ncbi:MAG: hypothetical protein RIR26_1256, partial [Pseudomonadota bacterium]
MRGQELVTLKLRLPFFILVVGLLSCGRKERIPRDAAQQGHGPQGLTVPENVYCPSGYSYDSKFHQCFGDLGVLGPFSDEMLNRCRTFGGGTPCDSLHWERSFAQELRGDSICPRGTEWDVMRTVCSQGEHVFGPFT